MRPIITSTNRYHKSNNDTGTTSRCSKNGCIQHKDIDEHELCSCACPGYGKECPCTRELVEVKAAKVTASLSLNSETLFHPQPPTFHVYRRDQLVIGKQMGAGGFCQVHQVTIKGDTKGDDKEDEKKYAIKFLRKTTLVDKKLYLQGAMDLAVEANFLAALSAQNTDNKHVVRLHGIADGLVEMKEHNDGVERHLYLIMDQLSETLEQRIQQQKEEEKPFSGIGNAMTRRSSEFREKRLERLSKRLSVGLQVAEAMQYLHSFHVVYRDLKPENVGFDSAGTVKIYDFGLAKELKESLKDEDGNYKMTGGAGSIRYMAPEVVLCQPYNASVDIYSFSILLCEVASLKKAFRRCDANDHRQQVVKGGQRPKLEYWFPEGLQTLLDTCWAQDASLRPSFTDVVASLQDVIDSEPEPEEEGSVLKTLTDLSYEVFL
jgi:serine/threonine protein kinase